MLQHATASRSSFAEGSIASRTGIRHFRTRLVSCPTPGLSAKVEFPPGVLVVTCLAPRYCRRIRDRLNRSTFGDVFSRSDPRFLLRIYIPTVSSSDSQGSTGNRCGSSSGRPAVPARWHQAIAASRRWISSAATRGRRQGRTRRRRAVGIAPVGGGGDDDVEQLIALRPTAVSYMPYRPDFDHLEAILGSGCNVVTTSVHAGRTGLRD